MLKCADGSHIPKVTLKVQKSGAKPLEYFTIKMTDVRVTSVSAAGTGGDDNLTETVTLNFSKIEVKYIEQDSKGGAGGATEFGWDILENEPL